MGLLLLDHSNSKGTEQPKSLAHEWENKIWLLISILLTQQKRASVIGNCTKPVKVFILSKKKC